MSGSSMEAPYAIASIPTPIDGVNGRIYAAPIYGIRDSLKRKRNEVVVGIDGESVNLYNVNDNERVHTAATDFDCRFNLRGQSHRTRSLRNPIYVARRSQFTCKVMRARQVEERPTALSRMDSKSGSGVLFFSRKLQEGMQETLRRQGERNVTLGMARLPTWKWFQILSMIACRY